MSNPSYPNYGQPAQPMQQQQYSSSSGTFNYQQPGAQPSASGYPQTGASYQPQTAGYQPQTSAYQQPSTTYQQSTSAYQPAPMANYQQPISNYQQSANPYPSYQHQPQPQQSAYPPQPQPSTATAPQQHKQQEPVTFDTNHEDLVHDAQFDYYGRRLATASSDRLVKIWSVQDNTEPLLQATLAGHEGPVWQVTWAHPQYGALLASCSFDGSVIIWKEQSANKWVKLKEFKLNEGSVNSISWSGLCLAAACSDGTVSVMKCKVEEGGRWELEQFQAHSIGCNSVSWSPSSEGTLLDVQKLHSQVKLASGGCDNLVKIWSKQGDEYVLDASLSGHSDWVRDVAFCPTNPNTLVSCSQDKSVLVHTLTNGEWVSKPLAKEAFADTLWRVSWSVAGSILAVAGGDNKVTLWRENEQSWEMLSAVDQSAL